MAAGLPTSVTTEIEFTAGVWTDVSTFVKGDSMEISVGADSAASGIQPGTLDLDLDNADGRFTPDNPTSTYYPNFIEGKRIRVNVTKGTTDQRFFGRIVALEPDFPIEPTQSVTRVSAVDMLGDLARIELSTHSQDLARRQTTPTVFYPLADSNGSDGFVDLFNLANRLTIRDVTAGSGGVDASSDSSLGDGQSYVALTSGKALWHASPGIPSSVTSGGWVLSALVNLSFASLGTVLTISKGRYVAGVTPAHALTLELSGSIYVLKLTSYDGSGTSTSSISSGTTGQLLDGWNYIQVTHAGALYVNNETTTTSRTVTNVDSLQIGGDLDVSVGQVLINNGVTTALLDARYEISYSVPLTLTDLLTEYALNVRSSDLDVVVQYSAASPTNTAVWPVTAGRTALDTLVAIAESLGGTAYHQYDAGPNGAVMVTSPESARPLTPAITLDAEGDLISGPTVTRDINRFTATSTATSRAGTVTVVSASATGVGATDESHEVALRSEGDLAALASFFSARGSNQRSRISRLTVDLANASNNLYPTLLSGTIAPGVRLRLSGLPSTYFGVTYIDGYVAGWTERPSVNGYEVTFNLDPADAPPEAAFDDTTYSRIPWGDGVCTLTSTITSSATSISLTFTGTALLSTSAGDYPLDLDLNGERVTITSAPAGGTSPRTVTVTRGVAPTVARAHSAGEPIDVWNAARIAL